MKIQQHAGVVVDAAGIPAGLRQASAGERGVARGKGGAKSMGCGCPPSPLYIGPMGGAGPRRWDLQGRCTPLGPLYKEGGGRAAAP